MKWSFKIGRILGVDVYLHATFLLLLAVVGVAGGVESGSVTMALRGVGFFVAVFGCVLLHEFGHVLAARRFGIGTRDVTLMPMGGVARLDRIPSRPFQELWVALAGPAVNVALSVGLAALGGLVDSPGVWPWRLLEGQGMLGRLFQVNLMLAAFNLLPAFPMDGGRVLRALLALRMEYSRATRAAATVGQAMALVFAFLGLVGLTGGGGNPLLLLIALFVWFGAGREADAVQAQSMLAGARVRDAMLTDFRTLAPADPLSRVVDLVMAGSQQDFPVVLEDRVVGVLTRKQLLLGLSRDGRTALVSGSMETRFDVAQPLEELDGALAGRSVPWNPVPVLEHGRMVGLLTSENVTDFLLIRSALRGG